MNNVPFYLLFTLFRKLLFSNSYLFYEFFGRYRQFEYYKPIILYRGKITTLLCIFVRMNGG